MWQEQMNSTCMGQAQTQKCMVVKIAGLGLSRSLMNAVGTSQHIYDFQYPGMVASGQLQASWKFMDVCISAPEQACSSLQYVVCHC